MMQCRVSSPSDGSTLRENIKTRSRPHRAWQAAVQGRGQMKAYAPKGTRKYVPLCGTDQNESRSQEQKAEGRLVGGFFPCVNMCARNAFQSTQPQTGRTTVSRDKPSATDVKRFYDGKKDNTKLSLKSRKTLLTQSKKENGERLCHTTFTRSPHCVGTHISSRIPFISI